MGREITVPSLNLEPPALGLPFDGISPPYEHFRSEVRRLATLGYRLDHTRIEKRQRQKAASRNRQR